MCSHPRPVCVVTHRPAPRVHPRTQLQLVYETLQLLGLYDIRHSQIGDERVRGISGGQRKRVNIGMELAADPTVLFLGGPTLPHPPPPLPSICSGSVVCLPVHLRTNGTRFSARLVEAWSKVAVIVALPFLPR
jgi:hypothetical protein